MHTIKVGFFCIFVGSLMHAHASLDELGNVVDRNKPTEIRGISVDVDSLSLGSEIKIARLNEQKILEHKRTIAQELDANVKIRRYLKVGGAVALVTYFAYPYIKGAISTAPVSVTTLPDGMSSVVVETDQVQIVKDALAAKKNAGRWYHSILSAGSNAADVLKQVVLWAAGTALLNEMMNRFWADHNLPWFIKNHTDIDQHVSLLRQYGKVYDQRKERKNYDALSCEKSIVLLCAAVAQELEMAIAFMKCRTERVSKSSHIRGIAYTIIDDLCIKTNSFFEEVEVLLGGCAQESTLKSAYDDGIPQASLTAYDLLSSSSLKALVKEFRDEYVTLMEGFAAIC